MTEQASQPSGERVARLVSSVVGALWLWVIPSLVAALAVRHLFPSASDPFEPAAAGRLAALAEEHSAALWAGFFLLFAVISRYWASVVPGALPEASVAQPLRSPARRTLSFALAIGAAALVAVFVRTSFFQSNRVLSSSMLPSLPAGVELAVNKLAYGFKLPGFARPAGALPRRGDVIVFRGPEAPEPGELVKRVIGLPGDRIGVVAGRPVINGWAPPACIVGRYPVVGAEGLWIAELLLEFLDDRTYAVLLPIAGQAIPPFPEYLVKPGQVFVLGDNRPLSVDSRAWNKGRGAGVPLDSISGRVDRILFGVDHNGRADLRKVLQPLALDLNLAEIDARKLEENVHVCLKLRPKDTYPPKPRESKVSK